ncbi:MAG TPA: tRNA epoxyqueuosine(34) reductase QueG [Thermoanaerobaculaceae bacterium]|nr:tRNA epoxyqueuosine(34) reductase QueG [Acidobacteriota bacterium]NLH10522.1 tRNA epoxyqueuosine(34) reductase QueG [Holophagae bacterium]HPW56947.1 tRNA epoxyqueuosine(34) reductase QueG [Thermoanaerobaculaceae bacterium]
MAVVDELRSYALGELGCDLFGVASAQPLVERAALSRWCADGHAADLPFVADTSVVRGDPQAFLAGARSVVCVAMAYGGSSDPPLPSDHVRVARYARRRDYHAAIRSRLVRLGQRLVQLLPGSRWRPAVDTAPLLERALAARAGLGFVGKSTMLIHPYLGPELLLGELVTTAALPPSAQLDVGCGSCRRCLEACPTGALTQPFVLDPRRCIACWTIEPHSAVPDGARDRLSGYVFGCDLCVLACPFARRPRLAPNPILATRQHLTALAIAELERLDEAGWRTLAAGTPLRRITSARLHANLRALR